MTRPPTPRRGRNGVPSGQVDRVGPRIKWGEKSLPMREINRVLDEHQRERQEWQTNLKSASRAGLAKSKLQRLDMKNQIVRACVALRRRMSGRMPTMYQVLGYLAQYPGNAGAADLLFAANVMNTERIQGRSLWHGEPRQFLPMLIRRKMPNGTHSWLESIQHVMTHQAKPLSTHEIGLESGIGGELRELRRINSGLHYLQTNGIIDRLPDRSRGGQPESMWQVHGLPYRVDYPNVFIDLLSHLPTKAGEWGKTTDLYAPESTTRGAKKSLMVGNPLARFTSTAVQHALPVLERAGIVKVRRDVTKIVVGKKGPLHVKQYFVTFTSLGAKLWADYQQTGVLDPRLIRAFVSRETK